VVLRPFAALALFGLALAISYLLRPLIPDGRVKRLLYDRTFRERRPEVFNAVVILLIVALVFFGIWVANP
jgi:hypothetical protein